MQCIIYYCLVYLNNATKIWRILLILTLFLTFHTKIFGQNKVNIVSYTRIFKSKKYQVRIKILITLLISPITSNGIAASNPVT